MTAATEGRTGVLDRRALVERHSVVLRGPDVRSPLSVGNGELCFTADITGMQTFPERYVVVGGGDRPDGTLLGTQAQWGWHSAPAAEPWRLEDVLVDYRSPGGAVPYVDLGGATDGAGERVATPVEQWLRANPHRLDLGRIGLEFLDPAGRAEPVSLSDLTGTRQVLDLWHGVLRSTFVVHGDAVEVLTVCHPVHDAVAVRVVSPAVRDGRLAVRLAFPYGAEQWHAAADWSRPERHSTDVERAGSGSGWRIARRLDGTRYDVAVSALPGTSVDRVGPHELRFLAGSDSLELVVGFVPVPGHEGYERVPRHDLGGASGHGAAADPSSEVGSFDDVRVAAAEHWARFWSEGGAVDLGGSDDERAPELERRVVLSQYLTAINGAGSLPPQETGLVCNSWFGKFHLEMHWWHAAHFALWGRPELLERSLRWYHGAAEKGRETARRQGYAGIRWPKMVGPDARESPSHIGPFLIWQQPHPIYLAELLYRAAPSRRLLDEYADVVFGSAEFMTSFATRTDRGFELGPPLIPAQESYAGIRTRLTNPTFELAYWQWGLETALRWRQRLGLEPEARWSAVARDLVRPHVRDGVYAAIDVPPYTDRSDHPSMLCALGFLPRTSLVDPETMRATLHDVLAGWDWAGTWGWDYPVVAMCAARLGEPGTAVSTLTMDAEKNHFLASGHNRQTASLPLYLPGNGGLLAAVALMTAGWDGAPERSAPGFPDDGRWAVQCEGLVPSP